MTAALLAGAFAWPPGLLLLAIPAALWIAVRRRRAPRREATGTLELWRLADGAAASRGARARRRRPPGLALLCASLVCGALALAGPRRGAATPAVRRLLLDRSPSMYLPWNGGDARRIDRALDAARASLRDGAGAGDEVRWVAWDGEAFVERSGAQPPAAWLRAPTAPLPPPPWERADRAGWTWITDAAPAVGRRRAGLCASGGAAVGGPVAYHDGVRTVWDAGGLHGEPAAEARTLFAAAEVPRPVRELARAWAAARGVGSTEDPSAASLRLRGSAAPPAAGGVVGAERDGWSAGGPAGALGAVTHDAQRAEGSETWLAAPDGRALVVWRPGSIEVAWRDPLEVAGDPAAFAVSWSALFDAALPPPAGIVAWAERQDAGAPLSAPGTARASASPAGSGADGVGGGPWSAWLAGLACLLAVAATRLEA